jgi:hypothetical protein
MPKTLNMIYLITILLKIFIIYYIAWTIQKFLNMVLFVLSSCVYKIYSNLQGIFSLIAFLC